MNKIVLDASALLAVLNREAGADRLTPEMLSTATSSTVNLTEVQRKLVSLGLALGDAWEATLSPIRQATAFTAEHAEAAGNLITKTRALGLSLGDRACLALGIALRAPVYTADKSWKKLKLGVPIHLIRWRRCPIEGVQRCDSIHCGSRGFLSHCAILAYLSAW